MTFQMTRHPLLTLCLLTSILGACGPGADVTDLGTGEQSIIGGSHAAGIAPVGHVFPQSNPNNFCTATLIAPDLILTAKHCVYADSGLLIDSDTVLFTLVDTNDSSRFFDDAVQAVEVRVAPSVPAPPNGRRYFMADLASDVAIYRLAKPITQVQPARVGKTLPGPSNANFIAVGFGRTSHTGKNATERNAGPLTFRQNGGSQLKSRFGSLYNYVFSVWQIAPGTPFDRLQEEFENEILAKDYEMWFDGPGNVQVCNGDSGGPLLKQAGDGAWEVYGVVSGSKSYGTSSRCYFGSVYATFGPAVMQFLRAQGIDPR